MKQRDLWITDFVPMQNIYKLVLAMTSKEIGNHQKRPELILSVSVVQLKSSAAHRTIEYFTT